VYWKIQILGITKIESQESYGVAYTDIQAQKDYGVLLLRHHTLHWHISSSLPLVFPVHKESMPYLLHSQLLRHSLHPLPQLSQLFNTVWFLMHFVADGFICITDLQEDIAKKRPSKSLYLLTGKLKNLPWPTHFPFSRWSKAMSTQSCSTFFFQQSFSTHLVWAQMEWNYQKKRKMNHRYVVEMMTVTDLDNSLADAIVYIPVILRASRRIFQLSARQIFSIYQYIFIRWQGFEDFHLKTGSFQAHSLSIFNTSFGWVCVCPL